MRFLSKKQTFFLLLVILILAGFFRLWQLSSIPPGLYPDEAINGNDALKTLENNQFKVFYPENNGREGLFIWLIAFSFKLFGPSAWSLRLTSAILGILTVLGLYLLAKELFNRKIGLLAAFFLAVSFWHVNFSRIGFRAILVPFLMTFSFYFLFKAFRKNSLVDFIWSGIFFGFGFYTYIAFRTAVLLLVLAILLKMIEYWKNNRPFPLNPSWLWRQLYLKDGWWKVDILLLVIIIIALPIGIYFLNNPSDFFGRAGDVSVLNVENPAKELTLGALKTLAMFNFSGDWNWRHNLAGSPMLVWPVGILFVLGVVLIVIKVIGWIQGYASQRHGIASGHGASAVLRGRASDSKQRNSSLGNFAVAERHIPKSSLFLLSWFIIMLLPAILTAEGLPHALRTIGVIPVVYIFAAFGLVWLLQQIAKLNPKIAWLVLIVLLVQISGANFNKYFFDWGQNKHVAGAFRKDLVDLVKYFNNLPNNIQKVVLVNEPGVPVPYPDGLPMPAQTIIFQSKISDLEIKYLVRSQKSKEKEAGLVPPALIVPLQYEEDIFEQLSKIWPDGKIKQINDFTAYEIK
jgi:4-amino-4-deoxy-L-arabinose transferase-like glycosyltransferase